MKNKLTLRQAVIQNCKDCIFDPLDTGAGTAIKQVENCKQKICALWEHRPLTTATKKVIRDAEYELMTQEEKDVADIKSNIARERFAKIKGNIK